MLFDLKQTTHTRQHARVAGLTMLVKWHLKKEERQLLYCHFISDQSGHLGIQHVSQKLYQKPLTALNERELASLVIVSRAPRIFLRDKTKLDLATTRFMAELP
jgi:membrane peptidoglycan carboxypeptidase